MQGLCDSVMVQEQSESDRRINLLFDEVTQHYRVIANLTGAMTNRYVCEECNEGSKLGAVHLCDQKCSNCMISAPCVSAGIRIPCDLCNRHFMNREWFDNHKKKTHGKSNKKSACDIRKRCVTCGALMAPNTNMHECYKRFCSNCNENKEVCHLCLMRPLKNEPVFANA
jgi:hypothetical protein